MLGVVATLKIKAAVVQGRAIKPAEVTELAALPGKPELYAKLLFVLQAPMVQMYPNVAIAVLLCVTAPSPPHHAGEGDGSVQQSRQPVEN